MRCNEMMISLNPLYSSHYPPKPLTLRPCTLFPTPKVVVFSSGYRRTRIRCSATESEPEPDNKSLPHSAIQRIADKLRSLGFTAEDQKNSNPSPETKSAGEIFVPLPGQLSKYRVGHTLDPSWSRPENPVPQPGSGNALVRYNYKREGLSNERPEAKRQEKKIGKVPTLAELNLEREELRRLTTVGIALKKKVKVGKAGITEGIVNAIHERWRKDEVVKIVCEDLCRYNMKRTHDLLERKTGGMVVWRTGTKILLYRGVNYKYPYFSSDGDNEKSMNDSGHDGENNASNVDSAGSSGPSSSYGMARPALIRGVGSPNRVRFQLPGEAELAEEADRLLDGLGPRFTDWWGYNPLPVDADLLPAIVPGYRKPFRLLPYGVKPTLTNDEMTRLKRLGRPLSCHFALGRNRNLQGLASSIIKLWEKCEIAKIAVKRGVQNASSELMAEELKLLTGGMLLSRDEEFFVLYRGKDFLPAAVSSAIEERKKHLIRADNQRATNTTLESAEKLHDPTDNLGHKLDITSDQRQGKLRFTNAAIKRTSAKLTMALEKKEKAEKLLADLEEAQDPQQPDIHKERITEEERYMLRKVGLKMGPFLLLGRRGVFAGTVENMHLHWKYRELVKIISKDRNFEAVHRAALELEAESGGILVGIEKVSKGYAIIVYRGKNYSRPASLRPSTLLSKRAALKRSLEAQRRESLKLHVLKLRRNIDDLKQQLEKDKDAYRFQSFNESKLAGDKDGVEANFSVPNNGEDASIKSVKPTPPENQSDQSSVLIGNETGGNESDSQAAIKSVKPTPPENQSEQSSVLIGNETGGNESDSQAADNGTHERQLISASASSVGFQSKQRNFSTISNAKHRVPDNEDMSSSVQSTKDDLEESVSSAGEIGNKMPARVIHLSNKDRLLLRKQALEMKKRPVFAVGRSNIVTGLAKAINAHFKKHPFAIVNVKGRAKGTSVQELVVKLQEETGGVFISQEPNKVILYRGWGAKLEPNRHGKNSRYAGKGLMDVGKGAVSPELIAAIKIECGLWQNQEKTLSIS